jgi:D-alanyl-D-alanine-carboxypeptidase/D-alanyl-D-alanine-endopeptidase
MIRALKYLFVGVIIALSFFSCENLETIDNSLPLEEKIDQLVEPVVDFGAPSAMIIGIIQNGEKSVYGYGDAGLGSGPPQSNTIFEIGSNTKTFTATLLSEFISEGLLSLDDSINQYLPSEINFPTFKGKNISLRDLITHTSGLPREHKNFDIDFNVWSDFTNEDYYAFLNDISHQAYPFDDYTNGNELQYLGTEFRYSNIGIAILGHILEIVSGKTFEELIEERICSRLGMYDTQVFTDMSPEQKERIPKAYNINQYEQEFSRDMGRHLAPGAILSTVDDMLLYMEANMENSSILSQSMQNCQEIIYTRKDICNDQGDRDETFPYEDANGIGMAWYINFEDGDTIVEHGGGYNHICHFKFNKTKKVGIVAFSNTLNVVDTGIIETIFEWITE